MTAAGKLDQRITITPVMQTRNTVGEPVEAPNTAAAFSVWANVREQGDAEKQRNGITTSDKTYAILMHYRADIDNDTSFTISYRGRVLNVSSSTAGGQNNREWLFISATEAK